MSHQILSKKNRQKYCHKCKEIIEIIIIGKNGYCPKCGELHYTLSQTKDYHLTKEEKKELKIKLEKYKNVSQL